jgi:pentatricopeptide repeat protein
LSRHSRGVKAWEEAAQAKAGDVESFDLGAVCNGVIENLKTNRYTKSSNLTKIFDHVATPEQLEVAEGALVSFRRSLSRPTPALPLVVVRACLRVGRADRALHYVREKVQYGIFPSRRVYHVLMDAFIREGDAASAVTVYDQMVSDEVIPDEMTFHLASKAHVMTATPEGTTEAISLCRQCYELQPKLGSTSFVTVVKALVDQGKESEALSLLTQLDTDQLLLPQTGLNLVTHVLMAVGELGRILVILREKLCVPIEEGRQLGLPQEAWPRLQTAVQDSGDEELITQLENLTRDLISNRKLAS